jgi:short-subunit dehydrogenase
MLELRAMNKTDPVQTCVLITGASSGIGAGLAREFARRGMRVALVARRVAQLELLAAELRAAGAQASSHGGDVTIDGDIARVMGELAGLGWTPHIVIANAGFGVVGNARELTLEDYRRQFETNVFGVLRTLHESLEGLRATRGRFVIMGSVAGHVSSAGSSPYTMSKFAVRALAEALHGDLRPAGVSCTLISPGFVDSDIRRVDNRGGLHAEAKDPIPAWLRMKTADAARVMARGILRGKKEVIVTAHAKAIIFMARHLSGFTRWVLLRANRGSRPEPKKS